MDGKQRAAVAVAARRGELDLTQQQLAAIAGVDLKTIGNLERRGKWPIARTRARIEKALKWEPGEMERIASEDGAQPPLPATLVEEIRKVAPAPEDQERVFEFIRLVRSGRLPRREAGTPGERQSRSASRAG